MKKNDLKKSVESMTGAGLVEYYNYLAATLQLPAVKRFSTRQAGITRTKSLVDQAEALIAAEEKKAAETVDGRKNPNGPVATCRFIFDKLHGPRLHKDSVHEGLSGSWCTQVHQWKALDTFRWS